MEQGKGERLNVVPLRPGTNAIASEPKSTGLLKSGDGGGTFGDMEARVAKLEASVSHLERDMGEVRADVRGLRDTVADIRERLVRLEERVAHLPGKGFIVTCTTVTLGLIVAVATLAPKIQALFGIAR